MSKERIAHGVESVVDVVSDNTIPPAMTTSLIGRTREQYNAMEPHEKRDFWLAVGATVGGVALTATAFVVEQRNPQSKLPTALRAGGYALDFVDGYFAKRSMTETSSGATTELGAVADPLADKINNTLNESSLVRAGKLHPAHLGIRAVRDVGNTVARHVVTEKTQGEVEVKATKFGKFNTLVRDGVNLFASTKTAEMHPKVNKILQTGATLYSVASGAITIAQLAKSYRRHKNKS